MKRFALCIIVVMFSSILVVSAQDSDNRTIITIENAQNIEQLATTGEGDITAVAFSVDGNLLAIGDIDGKLWLWDTITESEVMTLDGHGSSVNRLAFSPDGSLLASGDSEAIVKVWEVATGTELQSLDNPAKAVTSGQSEFICDLEFSAVGDMLGVGTCETSGDNTYQIVRVWDTTIWEILGTLEGGTGDVEFYPEGNLLTVKGSEILEWNILEGTQTAVLSSEIDGDISVAALSLSPDGNWIALSDYFNILVVANMSAEAWTTETSNNYITEIAFSPDATLVVTQEDSLFFDPEAGLMSMQWLPANELITLWNVETGDSLVTLDIDADRIIRSLVFSPDGTLLALGTEEGVQVWGLPE